MHQPVEKQVDEQELNCSRLGRLAVPLGDRGGYAYGHPDQATALWSASLLGLRSCGRGPKRLRRLLQWLGFR